MKLHRRIRHLTFLVTISVFCLATLRGFGQSSSRQKPPSEEEIISIKSELVQTDVMVFDKRGRLVVDLPRDEFQLTLDGKPKSISFFELIQTGSQPALNPEAPLSPSAKDSTISNPRTGRVIFFFLDDIHLSTASLTRARQALTEFIDKKMQDDDQVAIVSTSGQIGFLQQLTDNEAVLTEAVARLNDKRISENYAGRTIITEYEANRVGEHSDKNLFNYLVSSTINEYQLRPVKGGDPRGLDRLAVNNVKNRVGQINAQTRVATGDTLSVLLSLMRSSLPLQGRKLLFFLSDGFIADPTASKSMSTLKQVTELAARTGIVVYSMDVRGTHSEPQIDAARNDFPDGMGSGTSARMPSNETVALQEPLKVLADDTGGRAIINSNSIPDSFEKALNETSSYYLLAWRPDDDEQHGTKAKLKVTLKNHPELRVRLRRNYYVPPKVGNVDKATTPSLTESNRDGELLLALGSLYEQRRLPVTLNAGYQSKPASSQATLLLSMQIDRQALGLDETRAGDKNEVDVIGAAIDDRGVIVSFKQVLTVLANSDPAQRNVPVQWSQTLLVPPGLYQVRVAVRDRERGYDGSAQQWIVVPNLAAGDFQLSSLFVAEPKAVGTISEKPRVNVTRHFSRSSKLRYQTYVYNLKSNAAAVQIQTEVLQNGRKVVELPPEMIRTQTQAGNTIPYWTEMPLSALAPGKYRLQVSATDPSTGRTVSQRLAFIVD